MAGIPKVKMAAARKAGEVTSRGSIKWYVNDRIDMRWNF